MRTTPTTDGREHPTILTPHDHHPRPDQVEINSAGIVSLPPGMTYDLDVALSRSDYTICRVILTGADISGGGLGTLWREGCEVICTTDVSDARSHSVRTSTFKQVYACHYSKPQGDSYLSHKVFDSVTGVSNRYIALQDARIVGNILRLTFRNFHGGSAWLWVKGSAILR
jgi:hypothetical protein